MNAASVAEPAAASPFSAKKPASASATSRAKELVATGASTIGTACPFCNTMFRDALAATGEAAPQLLDIAQLAARSLPQTITVKTEQP